MHVVHVLLHITLGFVQRIHAHELTAELPDATNSKANCQSKRGICMPGNSFHTWNKAYALSHQC